MWGKIAAVLAIILFAMGMLIYFYPITGATIPKPVELLIQKAIERKTIPVVNSDTVMVKVYEYNCGDTELYYRGPLPRELTGLDQKSMALMFPAGEGWSVHHTAEEVTLSRRMSGLCGVHQQYRHLGVHDGHLAIYQGPLGDGGILMRIEEKVAVASLPLSIRHQLQKSATYHQLDAAEQSALKGVLEFPDELSLNTVLDTFDEYRQLPEE